jgi:hypothetical protein
MNTTPDETTLALWLDDELTGDARAAVDAWAAAQPGQIEAREAHRRYKVLLGAAIPASVEPPAPDFFNARIARMIETSAAAAPAAAKVAELPFWLNARSWFMPATAAAGMVFAFWIGSRTTAPDAPAKIADGPDVYVPESGVIAEWVSESEDNGGVIILTGVNAIPDSTNFTETVYLPLPREIDRTAGGKNGAEDIQ